MNSQRVPVVLVLATVSCSLAVGTLMGQGEPLDGLYHLRDSKTRRISSADPTGGNFDWVSFAPAETKTLAEIPGAGVIRRVYFLTSSFLASPPDHFSWSADRMRFRKLVLRMYWDRQKDPCVEVPMGDFFGAGLGTLRPFQSFVVSVNVGNRNMDFDGMVSYFPMPFENGARITLENDGEVGPDFHLYYHIDFEQYPGGVLPQNTGRFHAQWHRVPRTAVSASVHKNVNNIKEYGVENRGGKDNYVILDAEGRGNYVGFFLTVDNIAGGWYGEGDDMVFIDGEPWPPSYAGTGTEEIFDSACCPSTQFSGPYTGFYLIENYAQNYGGKNQMYRFFIHDPVRFQKSIRVTLEHGHANNFENDYTSTSFWYQKDPHKAFFPLPTAPQRLPGWPGETAQTLEKEAKLERELGALRMNGKVKLTQADERLWLDLWRARNLEFRELRYADFLRDVSALEALVHRYR